MYTEKHIDISLRRTRQRMGIQQQQFADEIGIARTSLIRIENENKVMVKHYVMIHHCYPEFFPYPKDFDEFRDEYIYQYHKIYGEYPTDLKYPVDYFDYSSDNLLLNIKVHKEISEESISKALGYANLFSVRAVIRKNRNFYKYKKELNEIFQPYFVACPQEKVKATALTFDIDKFLKNRKISIKELSEKTGISVSVLNKKKKKKEMKADEYYVLHGIYPDDYPLPEDFDAYSSLNLYFNIQIGSNKYDKKLIAKKLGFSTSTAMYKKIYSSKNLYESKKIIDSIFEPYYIAACRKGKNIIPIINDLEKYKWYKSLNIKFRCTKEG